MALAFTTGAAAGQQGHAPVKLLTVCEVLADNQRFAGRAVAVVGRLESIIGLIDRSDFLSQDACDHPVTTHGHIWANKILVWSGWEEGMPKPPPTKFEPDPSILARKILEVRQTTELGSHQTPHFKIEGRSLRYDGIVSTPNDWAVIYGRLMRMPRLSENCAIEGCGGDDVPLAIIAVPDNIQILSADGRPPRTIGR